LRAKIHSTADACKALEHSLRAELSLLESKRGIEEAESVSRLTELAFIFIPITFAASLFSMQVQELADTPPPAYAFVITAIVAVTVSYGLRLVQRSALVNNLIRTTANQIRTDKQIATKDIPMRAIASWGASKVRGRPLIVAAGLASIAFVLPPLWARAAMDVSFKVALTGVTLLLILLTFLALGLAHSPRIPSARNFVARYNILGFGPVWQVIASEVTTSSPPDSAGLESV
jgi:hypothetical protein